MNDYRASCPKEIYPKIAELEFYQQIPAISDKYNVISIDSYKKFGEESGGKIATMARIILNIEPKSGQSSQSSSSSPLQLSIIIKAMASSPAVLMSCREVSIYQDVIQELSTDFTHSTQTKEQSSQDNNATIHFIDGTTLVNDSAAKIFPVEVLTPPSFSPEEEVNIQENSNFTNYIDRMQSNEQFKAPKYYYGEINYETNGKLLLLGEMTQNSGHSGSFFGKVPHNDGYNTKPMLDLYPNLSQLDVTKMAFSSIAQLHAKYWSYNNNNGQQQQQNYQIPDYLPSYNWYFPNMSSTSSNQGGGDNDDDKSTPPQENPAFTKFAQEYNEFLSFGVDSWRTHLSRRQDTGFVVSPYMESIINAMIEKSTPEAFWKQYCPHIPIDPTTTDVSAQIATTLTRPPISIIHCDYFPHNTLISSSPDNTGLRVTSDTNSSSSNKLAPNFFVIDYEFTCVSSPAQDLAQWAISQVNPETIAQHEDELLILYYQQLEYFYYLYQYKLSNNTNPQDNDNTTTTQPQPPSMTFRQIYPLSQLKQDYILGFTKWIWLVLCSTQLHHGVPLHWLQFFIDQIEHFIKRHGITPETAPVLRR